MEGAGGYHRYRGQRGPGGYAAPVLDTAKVPQRTWPPEHAGELEDIALKDQNGADVRLGDMWRDRPAVLVFLRHYG